MTARLTASTNVAAIDRHVPNSSHPGLAVPQRTERLTHSRQLGEASDPPDRGFPFLRLVAPRLGGEATGCRLGVVGDDHMSIRRRCVRQVPLLIDTND